MITRRLRAWPLVSVAGAALLGAMILVLPRSASGARPETPVDPMRAAEVATDEIAGGDATGHCFALASFLGSPPSADDYSLAAALTSPGWVREGVYAGAAHDAAAAWNGRVVSTETGGAVWVATGDAVGALAIRLQPFTGSTGLTLWIEAATAREQECPADP